jgi:hypothetical protein
MTETHVASALRAKRAEISGYIHDLEKRIKTWRARLVHIDEAIKIFSPHVDPLAIPPKRTYRRTRYFAKGELHRRCLDMLREAKEPLAASDIAKAAMAAKGLEADAAITERVLTILRGLYKRRVVLRYGTTQNVRWAIAAQGE